MTAADGGGSGIESDVGSNDGGGSGVVGNRCQSNLVRPPVIHPDRLAVARIVQKRLIRILPVFIAFCGRRKSRGDAYYDARGTPGTAETSLGSILTVTMPAGFETNVHPGWVEWQSLPSQTQSRRAGLRRR